MNKLLLLSLIGGASAFAPAANKASSTALFASDVSESTAKAKTSGKKFGKEDLEEMAKALNPLVNFYDPLGLADGTFWEDSNEATIGFLRQAEIKHGRVAMAAFVGYCVQSNYHWPWKMTLGGDDFPSTDLSPEQQWDAIPEVAKWQIVLVIGFFEAWGEFPNSENAHYMRGGKPGVYPSFKEFGEMVHPVPFNLFDPFNLSKNKSPEKKAAGLLVEINNGRLAMIGIFGFLTADKIVGSVPFLNGIAIPYDGDVMATFAADRHIF